ncbi:MAG: stage V sporulation protein AC [Clostridia bacterium]|nr:stage V sporulation protein AC [Clostridia bacterium]
MSRITEKEYDSLTKQVSPNSPVVSDCIRAFLVGGAVCAFGQGLLNFYLWLGMDKEPAKSLVSVTLILITAMLTAAHLYDNYARFAGAGSLVPITGFANAVASPAVEFKSEGWILGIGANMFKIAGPVIVYGTVASVVYGVIYWITTLF